MISLTAYNLFDYLSIKFKNMRNNPEVMTAVNQVFKDYMDNYVPKDTGTLAEDVDVSEYGVEYMSDYAHYMYTGIVYGPNFPKFKNGEIVSWYSLPGMPKEPTERTFQYKNPLASSYWDKAMIDEVGEDFVSAVTSEIASYLSRKRWSK